MARFTIKTRTNGRLQFFVPDDGGYVLLGPDGPDGTLGRQLCEGGVDSGIPLIANAETLELKVRRWYRDYRIAQRRDVAAMGLSDTQRIEK